MESSGRMSSASVGAAGAPRLLENAFDGATEATSESEFYANVLTRDQRVQCLTGSIHTGKAYHQRVPLHKVFTSSEAFMLTE